VTVIEIAKSSMILKNFRRVIFCLVILFGFLRIDLSPKFTTTIFVSETINNDAEISTALICNALRNNLSNSALEFNFHLKIPRDQNDYTVLTLDDQSGDYSFVVNEQRQIVFYVDQQNSGYELTDLGKDMYREIAQKQKNINGSRISDLIDVQVVFEPADNKGEVIMVTGFAGNPAPSTVEIVIPKNSIQAGKCGENGRLGLELQDSSVGIEVAVKKSSLATRSIALRRSSAAAVALLYLALSCGYAQIKSWNKKSLAEDE
jgi:hypothetical protein